MPSEPDCPAQQEILEMIEHAKVIYDPLEEELMNERFESVKSLTFDLVGCEEDERFTPNFIFEALHRCCYLENLTLRLSSDDHFHLLKSSQLFQAIGHYNPMLRSFRLMFVQLKLGHLREGLMFLCTNCRNLTSIDLENSVISDQIVKVLVENCPQLEHLGLINCAQVTSYSVHLIRFHCHNIRSLDVSYSKRISTHSVQHLIDIYQNRCRYVKEELRRSADFSDDNPDSHSVRPPDSQNLDLHLKIPLQLKLMFSGVKVSDLIYEPQMVEVIVSNCRDVYNSQFGGNLDDVVLGEQFVPVSKIFASTLEETSGSDQGDSGRGRSTAATESFSTSSTPPLSQRESSSVPPSLGFSLLPPRQTATTSSRPWGKRSRVTRAFPVAKRPRLLPPKEPEIITISSSSDVEEISQELSEPF